MTTTKTISKINNGTFTLINKETKTYVTLKIHTAQRGKLKDKRIVSRLIGSDNENSYKGFAFVNDDDNIIVWKNSRNHKNVRTAQILRSMAIEGNASPYAKNVEMKLSKRCIRCNRTLTTPESIELGIGPYCLSRM